MASSGVQLITSGIVVCFVATVFGRHGNSSEKRLLHDLLSDYDSSVRPVLNSTCPVLVDLEMIITKVIELNTNAQTLTTLGWLSANWTDERLNWDPKNYSHIHHLVVSPSRVWLPDFTLANSGDGSIFDDRSLKFFKLILYNNGSLFWRPSGRFVSNCQIDITYFPFDRQICAYSFVNWAYSSDQVNLTFTRQARSRLFERYSKSSEWDVVNVSIQRSDVHYNFAPETFSQVRFTVLFRRRPMFYVVNIIILTLSFALLMLGSFKLPVKSGERISMVVSLLVAFSVVILTVQRTIPETSQAVPIITIYLVCFMFIYTAAIFATIFIVYLNQIGPNPPKWLYNLLRFWCFNWMKKSCQRNCWCDVRESREVCSGCTKCFGRCFRKNSESYRNLNIQDEDQAVPNEDDDPDDHVAQRVASNTSGSNRKSNTTRIRYKAMPKRRAAKKFKNNCDATGSSKFPNKAMRSEWDEFVVSMDKLFFWLFAVLFAVIFIMLIVIGTSSGNVSVLQSSDSYLNI